MKNGSFQLLLLFMLGSIPCPLIMMILFTCFSEDSSFEVLQLDGAGCGGFGVVDVLFGGFVEGFGGFVEGFLPGIGFGM